MPWNRIKSISPAQKEQLQNMLKNLKLLKKNIKKLIQTQLISYGECDKDVQHMQMQIPLIRKDILKIFKKEKTSEANIEELTRKVDRMQEVYQDLKTKSIVSSETQITLEYSELDKYMEPSIISKFPTDKNFGQLQQFWQLSKLEDPVILSPCTDDNSTVKASLNLIH